jgi:KaiC/GvpD/RAD55 family RecA-like ATPase
MSTVIRLPPELQKFLELPGPQTLVIRGAPGSGKTTLTLALLECFPGDRILVTCRVPSDELRREFPWLGDESSRTIQVVDTSNMDETVLDAARLIHQSRERLLSPGPEDAHDLAKFLWLPPPLQETWARIDPDRPALVIIDSWDALIEQYLALDRAGNAPLPDRGYIERLLIRRMSKTRAHVVLVLEREEQSALDYLVNGIVLTDRVATDERLQRWLTLGKLRGIRIDNAVYPYTLEGARFESILPLPPYSTLRPGPPDPEPDVMAGHLWPGSRAFANAFGRLAFGKTTLIELDESASSQVGDMLALPMIAHTIRAGGRVLLLPHSSTTPEDVLAGLQGTVTPEQFVAQTRIILPPGPEPQGEHDLWRAVIPIEKSTPSASLADPIDSGVLRFVSEGATPRTPGLIFVSLQGLMAVAAGRGIPLTKEFGLRLPEIFQTAIRGMPIHSVVLARHENELVGSLRVIASIRLQGSIRQGQIFLHGVAPWTPTYVLSEGSQHTPYDLRRVV